MAKPMVFEVERKGDMRVDITRPEGAAHRLIFTVSGGGEHDIIGRRAMILAALDVLLAMTDDEILFALARLDGVEMMKAFPHG